MREPLKDKTRLEHILMAADNVARYTDGKTFNDMQADDMMCYAVVYNIMSIGEAAYHLSKAFRKEHPETEWDIIVKMRNVVQSNIPPLREQIARYISETDWDEWEKNDVVIKETAVHKSLIQTALRMKNDGVDAKQISRYTGLPIDEIDAL